MSNLIGKMWKQVTCRRYTELASKSLDQPLTGREKVSFWLHHFICTFCRRSTRQLKVIEQAAQRISSEPGLYSNSDDGLSAEAKERIKEALKQ